MFNIQLFGFTGHPLAELLLKPGNGFEGYLLISFGFDIFPVQFHGFWLEIHKFFVGVESPFGIFGHYITSPQVLHRRFSLDF